MASGILGFVTRAAFNEKCNTVKYEAVYLLYKLCITAGPIQPCALHYLV